MLCRQVIDELEDYNNKIFISRASLLEIAMKSREGNLQFKDDFVTIIQIIEKHLGIKILEINNRHLITFSQLTYPKTHKDPFDHVIISQAITDKLCLISADSKMRYYKKQGLELLEN